MPADWNHHLWLGLWSTAEARRFVRAAQLPGERSFAAEGLLQNGSGVVGGDVLSWLVGVFFSIH